MKSRDGVAAVERAMVRLDRQKALEAELESIKAEVRADNEAVLRAAGLEHLLKAPAEEAPPIRVEALGPIEVVDELLACEFQVGGDDADALEEAGEDSIIAVSGRIASFTAKIVGIGRRSRRGRAVVMVRPVGVDVDEVSRANAAVFGESA